MSELTKQTNLHRRGGIYYLRIRVPKDLVSILDKREVKYSLKTSDWSKAKTLLSLETLKVQQLFDKERRRTSTATKIKPEVSTATIERAVMLWHEKELRKSELQIDQLRVGGDDSALESARQNLREELADLESNNEMQYGQAVYQSLIKAFESEGVSISSTDKEWSFAYTLIHQGCITQAYYELKRLGEDCTHEPFAIFKTGQPLNSNIKGAQALDTPLSALFDAFVTARRSDGVTEKTLSGYKLTFDFSKELFGANRDITTITSDNCRNFRQQLSMLPSNAKKKYPTLTLLEAIKAHKQPSYRLSAVSVNGHLNNLSAIFKFAVQEGFIDRNPAQHLKQIPLSKTKADARPPFTEKELSVVFQAPIYCGCEDDERGYNKHGINHPRRHRFWVPLIALYTGMRLNEICQMYVADIQQKDDILFFKIDADPALGKTIKNRQSERIIPIHNELIKIGFINYVNDLKQAGHLRLFPFIKPSASGSLSATFTKWFNNFLHALKIKQSKLCFHSFRHTFRDAVRDADINREIAAELGGWKMSESVMDSYGSGYQLGKLNDAIQQVQYANLNLEYLYIGKPIMALTS